MITFRNYQNKKFGVIGLAKTGIAAISSLLASGAEVFAWDDKQETRESFANIKNLAKAQLLSPSEWNWYELEALILSPGVPFKYPQPHIAVKLAKDANVRITSDIELLCEAQPNTPKIAITGTNGKSTTTSLIAHILKNAGFNGFKIEAGGNIGTPALALEPIGTDGCYVLELSSYQLDLIDKAHFNISILLNITPDHIDRHGDMSGYVEAKQHIFDRQNKNDFAIVNIDDDYSASIYSALKQTAKSKIIAISVINPLKQGIFVDKSGVLHDKCDPENQLTVKLFDIVNLTGKHNWQNAAFAYAACKSFSVSPKDIEKGLRTFPGLRHRLQFVATIHGVRFINDSKATNADATSYALLPFTNIYWIAGGKPKEGGISSLSHSFNSIVHAFLIGEAEEEFAKELDGKVQYTKCGTLANAVAAAAGRAFADRKQNAVVLFSPACASFDQWKNFEERGDAFCTLVENILDKVVLGKK